MPKATRGKLQNKLNNAIRHHSAGRLQKARTLYREILKSDPAHSDTLHMLGLLTHQQGDNVHVFESCLFSVMSTDRIANSTTIN